MGIQGRLAGRPQRSRTAIVDLDTVDDWYGEIAGRMEVSDDRVTYAPVDQEMAARSFEQRVEDRSLEDYGLDFEGDPYGTDWDLGFTAGLNYGLAIRQAAWARAEGSTLPVEGFDPEEMIDDLLEAAAVSTEVADGVRSGSRMYDRILTQTAFSGMVMATNAMASVSGAVKRGQQRANVIRAGMNTAEEDVRDHIRLPFEDRAIRLAVSEPQRYEGPLGPGSLDALGDDDATVYRDLPDEPELGLFYMFAGSYSSESVHWDNLERGRP